MAIPGRLPRLPASAYIGRVWVHWTLGIHDRKSGWLDQGMHAIVRELLLHATSRFQLHCPAYCLMPDHAHWLWMGLSGESDQRKAMRFLRAHWNAALKSRGCQLQSQAHDHVLRKPELDRDCFEDVILYVLRNPQQAGLVDDWREWPYVGAILPGYPRQNVRELSDYWHDLWKLHHMEAARRRLGVE